MKRFHVASKIIMNKLDHQTLVNSKKASRGIGKFLRNERFYWIRIIKKYNEHFKGFEKSWNQVIKKSSVGFLKELANAIPQTVYIKLPWLTSKAGPHHIAASIGKVI